MLGIQKLIFAILRVFPSLRDADLANLKAAQKVLLGARHALTMKILEQENTAEEFIKKNP